MADHSAGETRPWVAWSGLGAIAGTVLWVAMPWLQSETLGTGPYVATPFDVGSLVGWLFMAGGLVGARACVGGRIGSVGRIGVRTVAVGMVVVVGLLLRRVVVFVGAGFRAVPATGEDPAGLVFTWAFLLGFALVFVGAGLLGLGLRRLDPPLSRTAAVLVATPLLVGLLVVLRVLSLLPLPLGRVLVRTNLAFFPLAVGWVSLGRLVYTASRRAE